MNPVWHFVNGVPQIGPLTIGPSAVTSTVPILAPDGSAAAPGLGLSGNAALGFRRVGGSWVFGNNSSDIALDYNGAGEISVRSDGSIGFWSSTAVGTGSVDVSLSRGAANRLDLASGDSLNLVSGSYMVGGVAGASFSGAVTNITVVNGIVTAAS